jgi:hypothetical protein
MAATGFLHRTQDPTSPRRRFVRRAGFLVSGDLPVRSPTFRLDRLAVSAHTGIEAVSTLLIAIATFALGIVLGFVVCKMRSV